jgi:peptidoglycan/xylan/chitin deacetylase (PgdA/CDA1 family)
LALLLARFFLALFVASAAPALAACASTTALPPAQPPADPSHAWQEGPPPSFSPSQSQLPTTASAGGLVDYLARIPHFDAPPTPVRVALPHYTDHSALVHEIPTTQRVAFLTIDDGIVRHPMALELIQQAGIPVTLFLTTNYVAGNLEYFRALKNTGHVTIEWHTISHPHLTQASYGEQRNQLCGATDRLGQWYGQRPTLFRPPYGEWDLNTLRAAWSCGLQAGIHWRETVDAGNVYYQRPDKTIHAGDIILMHFRSAFPDDFIAALTVIKNAGLTPALLEDYVGLASGTPPPPPPTPSPSPPPPPPAPAPDATEP